MLEVTLSGEPSAAWRRLAFDDRRQAEEELVALTSDGKVYYKLVEELVEGDMAARILPSDCVRLGSRCRGTGG